MQESRLKNKFFNLRIWAVSQETCEMHGEYHEKKKGKSKTKGNSDKGFELYKAVYMADGFNHFYGGAIGGADLISPYPYR